MTIFTVGLALELPCRTLNLLCVWNHQALNINLFFDELGLDQTFSCRVVLDSCVHLSTSCDSLIWTLVRMLFLLALAWCEVCSLMPHQVHLSCLGSLATCFVCLVVDFEDSIFLANCLTLIAGNFSRSIY